MKSSVSSVSKSAGQASAPAREPLLVAATRGRPKKGSKPTDNTHSQDKTNDADVDDTEDVTVVGFTMKPTVPVPAFIAAAIMEAYVTKPEELALMIVRTIKQRASEDPDPDRATRFAETASYVPQWVICVAVNTRTTQGPNKWRVAASSAYSKRADEWARALHMKHLAVKARGLIRADDQSETPGRTDDAIRNMSSLLERRVASAVATSPQIPKTGFDLFPPSTKQIILFVSEKDALGRTPSRPVQTFADILVLSNVAYLQNHLHHFLRNTKGRDAFIPIGFCAAIRAASFLADASDRPGAFSLFTADPRRLHNQTRLAEMRSTTQAPSSRCSLRRPIQSRASRTKASRA
ncbi:hypothetical protein MHU86_2831 [Fragilaria crotonensis]|nr:hypothetical protein MHU86_2831 [Fragilaria crotonensis]